MLLCITYARVACAQGCRPENVIFQLLYKGIFALYVALILSDTILHLRHGRIFCIKLPLKALHIRSQSSVSSLHGYTACSPCHACAFLYALKTLTAAPVCTIINFGNFLQIIS